MISIITPWHGETGALLQDYYQAIKDADQVVSIDNACPPATAEALAAMTNELGGVYIRNETNLGFAAANNQGYARATGDIIVFLNSDVAPAGPWLHQVLTDVRDGALYGPSLQQQLVAGRWLPYLEGWCIAATRETWERLWTIGKMVDTRAPGEPGIAVGFTNAGPWDEKRYPGPYWEDNDLCFRAMQKGIRLVQTHWAIQHKGGQTAGPIVRHGASFAQNEHTFTERVLRAFEERTDAPPTPTYALYQQHLHTPSDMQHHLPLLYSLARGTPDHVKYVLELGTRGGVSTAALLAGVEVHGGFVWSIDVDDCSHLYKGHPNWMFIQGDSRGRDGDVGGYWADMFPSMPVDPMPACSGTGREIDLLLIDTEHTVEQVTAELTAWSPHMAPGGTICIHDPETFPGVRRAVTAFCAARGWPVTFVLPCHGMAVIEVPK